MLDVENLLTPQSIGRTAVRHELNGAAGRRLEYCVRCVFRRRFWWCLSLFVRALRLNGLVQKTDGLVAVLLTLRSAYPWL